MPQLSMHSPLGMLTLSETEGSIVAVDWGWGSVQEPSDLLCDAIRQMNAYFDGHRRTFDLPLSPTGSPFQRRIWAVLREIPFGSTRSYGEIAREIGTSARAVGQANRVNPLPVIIPCHRVVGQNGVGGYSGGDGLASKHFLLDLEREHLSAS